LYTHHPSLFSFLPSSLLIQGIGLGAVVSGATIITDKMLYAASEAVAASLTEEERAEGRVFPRVARIRQVSLKVATEVAKVSFCFLFFQQFPYSRFFFLFFQISKQIHESQLMSLLPPSLSLSLSPPRPPSWRS
jgi:hypothetical protein